MSPSGRPTSPDKGVCGCCKGLTAQTPVRVSNRPGLTALAYRVGTHSKFKNTMLAALSDWRLPGVQGLRTRDDRDFSIGLLDAFAAVADVLTFYQERIANESYLRTATERRSVLEMARTIGYKPSPGVAASVYLAFTLETAEGSPASVKVEAGTKAQSVPGQDETAQVFETIEEIEARGEWNKLRPRLSRPILPKFGDRFLHLKGTATNLKPGDAVLLVGDERKRDPGNENWNLRRIKDVKEYPPAEPTAEVDAGYTLIELDRGLGSVKPRTDPPRENPQVYAMRRQAGLFGHNAPDWRAVSRSVKASYLNTNEEDPIIDEWPDWPYFTIEGVSYPSKKVKPVDVGEKVALDEGLFAEYYAGKELSKEYLKMTTKDSKVDFGWDEASVEATKAVDEPEIISARWTGKIQPESAGPYTFSTRSRDGVRLWVDGKLIIDNWTDHAETVDSGTIELSADRDYDIKIEHYNRGAEPKVSLKWSYGGEAEKVVAAKDLSLGAVYPVHLDAVYKEIAVDSWVVLSIPASEELYTVEAVSEASRANFALSAKTSRLTLKGESLKATFNDKLRDTTVFCQSVLLEMADVPETSPVSGNSIILDRKVEGLIEGRLLALSGLDSYTGLAASEVARLDRVEVVDGLTKLVLAADLENTYKKDTVVVNANVAPATHGETTGEILGSGNSTAAFQAFTLRQPPLTHVSASTPSGTETTLEVRVNDLLWGEVSSLYGHGPEERVYTTRIADDGVTTIQFGDGLAGARLPTGTENIRAEYRKGIGLKGLVRTGQISQLLSMPLGLKGVTSPVAASGAQDMESLSEARHNAPLTVLTLDRVVSLKDYEDFTCSFAGIAKALATWTWDGEKRGVFITVAGPGGSEIKRGTKVYDNLLASLRAAGDSRVPIAVESYRVVCFRLGGRIKVQGEYRPETVLEDVERELRRSFAFNVRSFGQPVFLSEVIAIAQQVAGVVAVFVDRLYRTDQVDVGKNRIPHFDSVRKTAKYRDRIDAWWRKYIGERVTDVETFLEAAAPQAGETGVLAAELLTLDPGPLGLEVIS